MVGLGGRGNVDCVRRRRRDPRDRGWTAECKFVHSADVAMCFASTLYPKLLTPESFFQNK